MTSIPTQFADTSTCTLSLVVFYTTPTARAGRKEEKMSKMERLLAALIIVTILALVFFISGLITKLLMLLPSPWCHIAIVSYLAVLLVGGIYVILGKIEQEKRDNNHIKPD